MRRLTLVLLLAGLGCSAAHAGVFDDDEARRQIADLRIKTEARFDQQSRAQLELSAQIQRQAEEIAQLRGLLETLMYKQETGDKRVQDFYLDLDSRLRKLEPQAQPAAAPADGADVPGDVKTAISTDPAKESADYDAALVHFKAGRYKEAAAAFTAFVGKYPNGSLAANAQYWLGNAWYAQRNCVKAIEAQTVVTTKYAATQKAPDAWLAISTCQQEMGNPKAAKASLQTLIDKYPTAPAAETARERLKKK